MSSTNVIDYFGMLGKNEGAFIPKPIGNVLDGTGPIAPKDLWQNSITDVGVYFPGIDTLSLHDEGWELIDILGRDNLIDSEHDTEDLMTTLPKLAIKRRKYSGHPTHIVDIEVIQRGQSARKGFLVLTRSLSGAQIADLSGDPKNERDIASHILIAVKRCSNDVENFIKGRPIIDNICFINASQEEFPDGHVVIETNVNKNNLGTKEEVFLCFRRQSPIGICDMSYECSTLDRYPREDIKGLPLPTYQLPTFAFPHGLRLRYSNLEDYPLPDFFSFVFTDETGKHLYSACLQFYEIAPKKLMEELFDSIYCGADGSKRYHLQYGAAMQLFCPKVICVVSQYPFYRAMRRYLRQLYSLSLSSTNYPIEFFIAAVVAHIPMPVPGGRPYHIVLDAGMIGVDSRHMPPIEFDVPAPLSFPHMDLDFSAPLKCLSVDNMLCVFGLMLRERKLVFTCTSDTLLTEVMETLRCLLFPLEWSSTFVSRLPDTLRGLLEAPGGFMVGMDMANIQGSNANSAYMAADWDPLSPDNNVQSSPSRWGNSQKEEQRLAVRRMQRWLCDTPLSRGTIIVDLSANKLFTVNELLDIEILRKNQIDAILGSLPQAPRKRLTSMLQRIVTHYEMGPSGVGGKNSGNANTPSNLKAYDSAFEMQGPGSPDGGDWSTFPTMVIRDSFLIFMSDLLGSYWAFIIPPSQDLECNTFRTFKEEFNTTAYLQSAHKNSRALLEAMMETQMFASLLQVRSEGRETQSAGLCFFEKATRSLAEMGLSLSTFSTGNSTLDKQAGEWVRQHGHLMPAPLYVLTQLRDAALHVHNRNKSLGVENSTSPDRNSGSGRSGSALSGVDLLRTALALIHVEVKMNIPTDLSEWYSDFHTDPGGQPPILTLPSGPKAIGIAPAAATVLSQSSMRLHNKFATSSRSHRPFVRDRDGRSVSSASASADLDGDVDSVSSSVTPTNTTGVADGTLMDRLELSKFNSLCLDSHQQGALVLPGPMLAKHLYAVLLDIQLRILKEKEVDRIASLDDSKTSSGRSIEEDRVESTLSVLTDEDAEIIADTIKEEEDSDHIVVERGVDGVGRHYYSRARRQSTGVSFEYQDQWPYLSPHYLVVAGQSFHSRLREIRRVRLYETQMVSERIRMCVLDVNGAANGMPHASSPIAHIHAGHTTGSTFKGRKEYQYHRRSASTTTKEFPKSKSPKNSLWPAHVLVESICSSITMLCVRCLGCCEALRDSYIRDVKNNRYPYGYGGLYADISENGDQAHDSIDPEAYSSLESPSRDSFSLSANDFASLRAAASALGIDADDDSSISVSSKIIPGRPIGDLLQCLGLLAHAESAGLLPLLTSNQAVFRAILIACGFIGGPLCRAIAIVIYNTMLELNMVPDALTHGQYMRALSMVRCRLSKYLPEGETLDSLHTMKNFTDAHIFLEEIGWVWFSERVVIQTYNDELNGISSRNDGSTGHTSSYSHNTSSNNVNAYPSHQLQQNMINPSYSYLASSYSSVLLNESHSLSVANLTSHAALLEKKTVANNNNNNNSGGGIFGSFFRRKNNNTDTNIASPINSPMRPLNDKSPGGVTMTATMSGTNILCSKYVMAQAARRLRINLSANSKVRSSYLLPLLSGMTEAPLTVLGPVPTVDKAVEIPAKDMGSDIDTSHERDTSTSVASDDANALSVTPTAVIVANNQQQAQSSQELQVLSFKSINRESYLRYSDRKVWTNAPHKVLPFQPQPSPINPPVAVASPLSPYAPTQVLQEASSLTSKDGESDVKVRESQSNSPVLATPASFGTTIENPAHFRRTSVALASASSSTATTTATTISASIQTPAGYSRARTTSADSHGSQNSGSESDSMVRSSSPNLHGITNSIALAAYYTVPSTGEEVKVSMDEYSALRTTDNTTGRAYLRRVAEVLLNNNQYFQPGAATAAIKNAKSNNIIGETDGINDKSDKIHEARSPEGVVLVSMVAACICGYRLKDEDVVSMWKDAIPAFEMNQGQGSNQAPSQSSNSNSDLKPCQQDPPPEPLSVCCPSCKFAIYPMLHIRKVTLAPHMTCHLSSPVNAPDKEARDNEKVEGHNRRDGNDPGQGNCRDDSEQTSSENDASDSNVTSFAASAAQWLSRRLSFKRQNENESEVELIDKTKNKRNGAGLGDTDDNDADSDSTVPLSPLATEWSMKVPYMYTLHLREAINKCIHSFGSRTLLSSWQMTCRPHIYWNQLWYSRRWGFPAGIVPYPGNDNTERTHPNVAITSDLGVGSTYRESNVSTTSIGSGYNRDSAVGLATTSNTIDRSIQFNKSGFCQADELALQQEETRRLGDSNAHNTFNGSREPSVETASPSFVAIGSLQVTDNDEEAGSDGTGVERNISNTKEGLDNNGKDKSSSFSLFSIASSASDTEGDMTKATRSISRGSGSGTACVDHESIVSLDKKGSLEDTGATTWAGPVLLGSSHASLESLAVALLIGQAPQPPTAPAALAVSMNDFDSESEFEVEVVGDANTNNALTNQETGESLTIMTDTRPSITNKDENIEVIEKEEVTIDGTPSTSTATDTDTGIEIEKEAYENATSDVDMTEGDHREKEREVKDIDTTPISPTSLAETIEEAVSESTPTVEEAVSESTPTVEEAVSESTPVAKLINEPVPVAAISQPVTKPVPIAGSEVGMEALSHLSKAHTDGKALTMAMILVLRTLAGMKTYASDLEFEEEKDDDEVTDDSIKEQRNSVRSRQSSSVSRGSSSLLDEDCADTTPTPVDKITQHTTGSTRFSGRGSITLLRKNSSSSIQRPASKQRGQSFSAIDWDSVYFDTPAPPAARTPPRDKRLSRMASSRRSSLTNGSPDKDSRRRSSSLDSVLIDTKGSDLIEEVSTVDALDLDLPNTQEEGEREDSDEDSVASPELLLHDPATRILIAREAYCYLLDLLIWANQVHSATFPNSSLATHSQIHTPSPTGLPPRVPSTKISTASSSDDLNKPLQAESNNDNPTIATTHVLSAALLLREVPGTMRSRFDFLMAQCVDGPILPQNDGLAEPPKGEQITDAVLQRVGITREDLRTALPSDDAITTRILLGPI